MKTLTHCRLCLTQHDEEIHEATIRLHTWMRDEILRQITPWRPALPQPAPEAKH